MSGLNEAAYPVNRALMERELIAGVPQIAFMLEMILAALFVFVAKMNFMAVVIIVLHLIVRQLTKKDPFLADIVLKSLTQPDGYYP
jgi:type IV secretory pathway VirB3-like protein